MTLSESRRGAQSNSRRVFIAFLLACAFVVALVPSAFAAAIPQLTGASSDDATQARFAATGTGKVFVEVKCGDKVLAKNLAVSADDKASTLTLDGIVAGQSYELAFASSPNGKAEAQGAVATVYAQCGDVQQAIGLRTAIDGKWAGFTAPASRIVDGARYMLRSSAGSEAADGTLTFAYDKDESSGDLKGVTGTISYVDQNGKTVRIDKIPEFLAGEGTEVSNLVFASSAGKTTVYLVVGLKEGQTMQISPKSGQTDFIVYVRELAVNKVEGAFDVSIKYVDAESGEVLFTDGFLVNKAYKYTAPSQFYKKDDEGKVQVYKIDSSFAESNPIELTPGNAPQGNEVKVPYSLVRADQSVTWTVQFLNGANGKGSQLADAYTTEVEPGEKATYEAKPLKVDGEMFYPAGVAEGKSKTVSYLYGADNLVETVYYVPAGYKAKSYKVTVQYVNLADNSVIGKATLVADPMANADLEIMGPEELNVDGEKYLRLAGQDQPQRHNFNCATRTYTVYYRNSKDNLLANARVTHVTTTTTRRNEVETVQQPGTTTGVPAQTSLGVNDNQATVIQRDGNDDGSYSTANDEGIDSSAERSVIEGDATPLASGQESQNSQSGQVDPLLIAAGMIVVLVAAGAMHAFFKRRRSANKRGGGARHE